MIFFETTEVVSEALDSLSVEAESLRLRAPDQDECDILYATIESLPVNGENVEVTQMFTYLGYQEVAGKWLCGASHLCAKG